MQYPDGRRIPFELSDAADPDQSFRDHQRPHFAAQTMIQSERNPASVDQQVTSSVKQSDFKSPFAKKNFGRVSGYYGLYQYDTVNINDDGGALLLSDPLTGGLNVSLEQQWNEKWVYGLEFTQQHVEIRKPKLGSVENGKQNLEALKLNATHFTHDRLKSILGVSYEERLYMGTLQGGAANIKSYFQPSLSLALNWDMWRFAKWSFDSQIEFKQWGQAQVDQTKMFDSGEYAMGLAVRRQLDRAQIELRVTAFENKQKSELTTQKNTGIETQLGLQWDIDQ